jgi:hypothetical protein
MKITGMGADGSPLGCPGQDISDLADPDLEKGMPVSRFVPRFCLDKPEKQI